MADAISRLQREFVYPDEAGAGFAFVPGTGGGAPTVVVAASDAPELSKLKADFVCDGTNDEVEIQAAIDSLPFDGGRVLLTTGEFHPDWDEIKVPHDVHIQGMGRGSTVIDMNDTNPTAGTGPVFELVTGGIHGSVRDLTIDMPSNGISSQVGIRTAQQLSFIDNVFISFCQGNSIEVKNTANLSVVRFCHIEASELDGMTVEADWCLITGNIVDGQSTGNDGIVVFNSAIHTTVSDNIVINLTNDGIVVGTTSWIHVTGNQIQGISRWGIWSTGGEYHTITDNTINSAGQHGIVLNDTDSSIIADNLIMEWGFDSANTYDGVFLENDADRNYIHGNLFYPSQTTSGRYAINISESSCDVNQIGDNAYGDLSQYGAAPLNDAGTGTLYPNPQMAGTFFQDDVAAAQAAVVLNLEGGNRAESIMVRDGSATGISVHSNEARTAGTLTVDVTINGAVTGLTAVLDAADTETATGIQVPYLDVYSAGDRIGVKITTDGAWAPITADITVMVEVRDD